MVTVALTAGIIILGTALGVVANSLRHRTAQLASANEAILKYQSNITRLTTEREEFEIEASVANAELAQAKYHISRLEKARQNSHYRIGKKLLPLGELPSILN